MHAMLAFGLGMPEILVVAGIGVLLFGGKAIGNLGKGVGEAIREFRKVAKDGSEVHEDLKNEWDGKKKAGSDAQ